jgi:hypothetical protein
MEQASDLSERDALKVTDTLRASYPGTDIWCGWHPRCGWVWYARRPGMFAMSDNLITFTGYLASETTA